MCDNTFLGALAKAYTSRYDDLSEFCFIFPNRRSGTFFLRRLSETLSKGKALLAPDVMPVGDFMSRISGYEVAPRITQLMQLYLAYRDLRKRRAPLDDEKETVDFDEFLPWGEVVLSDMSEVDMYDVDAHKIFKNVEDYRKIQTDPLTEEQKELVSRFFGYIPTKADADRFWITFDENEGTPGNEGNEPGRETNVKERFLELWQLLPELYDRVRERLENLEPELPMTLAGTGYRMAMNKVLDGDGGTLPWKRVVCVGLDWMTVTEIKLFEELKKQGIAEFFWDLTGPVLTNSDSEAGKMIRQKMSPKTFPQPEWAEEYMAACRRDAMPEITEIGVPSNAMQAKIAGDWVRRLMKDPRMLQGIREARVAIVLPDETLLLPQLYSLPPDLDKVNLTMGLSMRHTSTASFIYHLQRLHQRMLTTGGQPGYLTQDLSMLLAQPVVQLTVGPDRIREINTYLSKSHRRVLSCREIQDYSPVLYNMLRPVPRETPLQDSVRWLQQILLDTDRLLAASNDEETGMKATVERMQIQVYLSALFQIATAGRLNKVEMRPGTLFHMLARMVGGEKIEFEGKPLEGLQVMGLLETRALDFDQVIILSMNDKVMPRRARRRSFIPDSLRRGFGMPPATNDEKLYGYWFYRLLSRAGTVTLVYDSRVGEGMRSGGKSRYLMQLEKLYDRGRIRQTSCSFKLGATPDCAETVDKREVMDQLRRFLKPDGDDRLNLSASALQNYLKCPLQFYYRNVLRYNDDPAPSSFIDPITQGKIVHGMLEELYLPGNPHNLLKRPKTVSARDFDAILADSNSDNLRMMMRRHVNREFHHARTQQEEDAELTHGIQMVADRLLEQVKAVVRHDRRHAPLRLMGVEVRFPCRWKVDDDLTVNMTATYDRVDYNPDGRLRIVDYKTGSVHLDMADLDAVFGADYKAGNIFQLLLYAHLLEHQLSNVGNARPDGDSSRELKEGDCRDIDMAIFDTNYIQQDGDERYITASDKTPVRSQHDPKVAEFIPRVNEVIKEIFDPDVPFSPTGNRDTCAFCVMRGICNR